MYNKRIDYAGHSGAQWGTLGRHGPLSVDRSLPLLKTEIHSKGVLNIRNNTSNDNVLNTPQHKLVNSFKTVAMDIGSMPTLPAHLQQKPGGRFTHSPPQVAVHVPKSSQQNMEFLQNALTDIRQENQVKQQERLYYGKRIPGKGIDYQVSNHPVTISPTGAMPSSAASATRPSASSQESRNPITSSKEAYHLSTQKYDYPQYEPYDMAYAKGVNQKRAILDLEGRVMPVGHNYGESLSPQGRVLSGNRMLGNH
jgi:hypothetical protein